MVTHYFKVLERRGATVTSTLCGRSNAKSSDGLNSSDDRAKVTCKFCLARLTNSSEGR